jgi:hypothetical protein
MSGNFGITSSSVSFSSLTNVSDQFTLGGGTGSFAGSDGTNDVNSISGAVNPVNTAFTPTVFISFPSGPAQTLNLDFIDAGVNPSTGCAATPPAGGQTCTPAAVSGQILSMLNLDNTSANASTVSWTVSGVTSDGLSTWSALFTAQFIVPYQTLLAEIAAGDTVTDTYSATVDVTPNVSPTPEPGTLVLFGSGLLGVAGLIRRKVRL